MVVRYPHRGPWTVDGDEFVSPDGWRAFMLQEETHSWVRCRDAVSWENDSGFQPDWTMVPAYPRQACADVALRDDMATGHYPHERMEEIVYWFDRLKIEFQIFAALYTKGYNRTSNYFWDTAIVMRDGHESELFRAFWVV